MGMASTDSILGTQLVELFGKDKEVWSWEDVEFPVQRRVLKVMFKFLSNEKRKSRIQRVIHREDTRPSF